MKTNEPKLSAVEWAARYPDAIPAFIDRFTGNIHVGVSFEKVIELFIERHAAKWATLPEEEQKQYLLWLVHSHRQNRELYDAVMSGRLARAKRRDAAIDKLVENRTRAERQRRIREWE